LLFAVLCSANMSQGVMGVCMQCGCAAVSKFRMNILSFSI